MPYRVGVVGCGRMAGSIDDEVLDYQACILPYCHAAAYRQMEETEMVAAVDTDHQARERFMTRWEVARGYESHREMIEEERPDIVSVTTHATSHAEISIFAAEHGVKGIYCEKAMCCSLEEADRVVEAVQGSGAAYNIGTTRRYHPGFHQMRDLIASGRIGEPRSVVSYAAGSLLHTHSHCFDLMLFLLGDPELEWAQGYLAPGDYDPQSDRWPQDPVGAGTFQFAGGAQGHQLMAPGAFEWEVLGSEGAVRATNNGIGWSLRTASRKEGRWRLWDEQEFPHFQRVSPTVRCIQDLIRGMETGERTLGHVEIARRGLEMSIAIAASHRRGGARVYWPLQERSLYIASR